MNARRHNIHLQYSARNAGRYIGPIIILTLFTSIIRRYAVSRRSVFFYNSDSAVLSTSLHTDYSLVVEPRLPKFPSKVRGRHKANEFVWWGQHRCIIHTDCSSQEPAAHPEGHIRSRRWKSLQPPQHPSSPYSTYPHVPPPHVPHSSSYPPFPTPFLEEHGNTMSLRVTTNFKNAE